MIAYWHLARLGILALSYMELLEDETPEERNAKDNSLKMIANRIAQTITNNPAALRPILDLQHIELFLVWITFWHLGRLNDIYTWLQSMRSMLIVRRARTITLPFIDGRSSLETVFEYAATGQRPPEFCDESSLLLLCILEWCFCLEPDKRDNLILRYYREIVLGQDSFGQPMRNCKPIDLIGWLPPEDWNERIFENGLDNEGEAQAVETFQLLPTAQGSEISAKIEAFIRQCRKVDKSLFPAKIPSAAVSLACLKLRSPLPPELWRTAIFGPNPTRTESVE